MAKINASSLPRQWDNSPYARQSDEISFLYREIARYSSGEPQISNASMLAGMFQAVPVIAPQP